ALPLQEPWAPPAFRAFRSRRCAAIASCRATPLPELAPRARALRRPRLESSSAPAATDTAARGRIDLLRDRASSTRPDSPPRKVLPAPRADYAARAAPSAA